MNKKKKIIIVLSVLALLGIAGWQHWEYHYNTPVAIVYGYGDDERVYPLGEIEAIIILDDTMAIMLKSGENSRVYESFLEVVNRQNEKMDITPQEALVLSQ